MRPDAHGRFVIQFAYFIKNVRNVKTITEWVPSQMVLLSLKKGSCDWEQVGKKY